MYLLNSNPPPFDKAQVPFVFTACVEQFMVTEFVLFWKQASSATRSALYIFNCNITW